MEDNIIQFLVITLYVGSPIFVIAMTIFRGADGLINSLLYVGNIFGVILLVLSLAFFYCMDFSELQSQRGECGIGSGGVIFIGLIIQFITSILAFIFKQRIHKNLKFFTWLVIPAFIVTVLTMELFSTNI